jgi:hypothetical protein
MIKGRKILTEEEAKTKWCPMVRFHVGGDDQCYDNKPQPTEQPYHARTESVFCIASDCMMWRWKWPYIEDNDTEGYCGLGSKEEWTKDG